MGTIQNGQPYTSHEPDDVTIQLGRFNQGVNGSGNSSSGPSHETIEITSDVVARFGQRIIVDTRGGDVSVFLPESDLGQETIIVVKNDDSSNVVWLIGTVGGQVNRSIFNANESLELTPVTGGYIIS